MKKILLALSCVLMFSTCKKDKDTGPELPETPPVTTGNLSGKINHYDQFGTLYTTALNNATVTIEGKNFKSITDEAGRYTLSNVPSNTYTLVFNKPGCGTIKRQVLYKFTDTVTYNANIADIPVFSINTAYSKDTTWFAGTLGGIYYNASTTPVNNAATIVAIVGKSANIDIANPKSYLNYATAALAGPTDFNRFLSYPLLRDTYTFKQDSFLYMKIYPISKTGASYYDVTLNKPVYTAYGQPYSTVFTLKVK